MDFSLWSFYRWTGQCHVGPQRLFLNGRELKITLPAYKAGVSANRDEGKILGLLCGGYTLQSQDKDICEDSFTFIDRYKAKGNAFHMLGVADGVHIEEANSKEYGYQLLKSSERMSTSLHALS